MVVTGYGLRSRTGTAFVAAFNRIMMLGTLGQFRLRRPNQSQKKKYLGHGRRLEVKTIAENNLQNHKNPEVT